MGHRMSPRTNRSTPRFSWKHARTTALTYATSEAAEAEIAAKGLKRCTVEEFGHE